ncbi:hypothetical protein M199_gp048 [Halogranum tailed virus 1]|uniref:Uncharacterized protein n=1 Tax=Halogranum tailed virus 1 TaxID=1273749 RepID=R4TMH6_9CAUD|nr:hypothetical protein M199_gp048 [Halogranum tailed virus 1]AGM11378.1 hypothetical protein HGTV1_48 [Halogranum tailed virus 1]
MVLAKLLVMTIAGFIFFISPVAPFLGAQAALLAFGFMAGSWVMYLMDLYGVKL